MYKVASSEKVHKTGADTETMALLYLFSFYEHNKDIQVFIIDFFNDITGANNSVTKLWDLQSKGNKDSHAKGIGRELVTLYKNYISSFSFENYLLFMLNIPNSFRKDSSLEVFTVSNIKNKALSSLKLGLEDECKKRTYITSESTSSCIDEFLSKVTFVVNTREKSDYIKKIIEKHPKTTFDEDILISIFNEIRKEVSGKKDNTIVEGVRINSPSDSLLYARHIEKAKISDLILQRILKLNPIKDKPVLFQKFIKDKIPLGSQDIYIQDAQSSLTRLLFSPIHIDAFWILFSSIYSIISENKSQDLTEIYGKIDTQIVEDCYCLTPISTKLLIAIIIEGLENDN